ncbi:MAG: hypothetical protein K9L79_06650 [Methylobacter tundripaludum]|nr:hypothetical protein [Methylobacter tundripaludum]
MNQSLDNQPLYFTTLAERIREESNRFEMEVANNPFLPNITEKEDLINKLFVNHYKSINSLIPNSDKKEDIPFHCLIMGVEADKFYITSDGLIVKHKSPIRDFLENLLVMGYVWEQTPSPFRSFIFPVLIILYKTVQKTEDSDDYFQCTSHYFEKTISRSEMTDTELFKCLQEERRFAAIHVIDNYVLSQPDENNNIFETIKYLSIQFQREWASKEFGFKEREQARINLENELSHDAAHSIYNLINSEQHSIAKSLEVMNYMDKGSESYKVIENIIGLSLSRKRILTSMLAQPWIRRIHGNDKKTLWETELTDNDLNFWRNYFAFLASSTIAGRRNLSGNITINFSFCVSDNIAPFKKELQGTGSELILLTESLNLYNKYRYPVYFQSESGIDFDGQTGVIVSPYCEIVNNAVEYLSRTRQKTKILDIFVKCKKVVEPSKIIFTGLVKNSLAQGAEPGGIESDLKRKFSVYDKYLKFRQIKHNMEYSVIWKLSITKQWF